MTRSWTAGTTPLRAVPDPALVVVVVGDDALVEAVAAAADEAVRDVGAPPTPIEVRTPIGEATRGPGDVTEEVMFIVGQLALGAGGNAVWVALESLWKRLLGGRRRAAVQGVQPVTRITAVYPSGGGETRIESVTIGWDDTDAALERLERLRQIIADDQD